MSKIPLVLVLAVLSLAAWASNLGEPLDCSDWVFLEPGFTRNAYAGFGEVNTDLLRPDSNARWGGDLVVTNDATIVQLRFTEDTCPTLGSIG